MIQYSLNLTGQSGKTLSVNSAENGLEYIEVYNTGQTYTMGEVDNLLTGITTDLSGYYTTAQTYNTGETYNIYQTYNTGETYNTGQTYTMGEVDNLLTGITLSNLSDVSGETFDGDILVYSAGTWISTGCIDELHVHNLSGCSPINVLTDINICSSIIPTPTVIVPEGLSVLFNASVTMGSNVTSYNGKLYGTNVNGGSGAGMLYEYDFNNPNTITILYNFIYGQNANPYSPPIEYNGKLYGTTAAGGQYGSGTLYEYDFSIPNTVTNLVNFDGNNYGQSPYSSPIVYNVKLYGKTSGGGTNNGGTLYVYDFATIQILYNFESMTICNDMTLYNNKIYCTIGNGPPYGNYLLEYDFNYLNTATTIYTFTNAMPYGIMQYNGKLYGTTLGGGSYSGGTLYEYDFNNPNTITILYNFPNYSTIRSGVIEYNGKLYGTSQTGGVNSAGTLYEYDFNTSSVTYLKEFDSSNYEPSGVVTEYNGKLYGTTSYGGTNNVGTLYEYGILQIAESNIGSSANTFTNIFTDKITLSDTYITNISNNSGLTENSDLFLPTQKAVKSYVDILSCNYTNILYNDLKTLYDNSGLIEGKYYKITDYQTVHNILDGIITTNEINTGNTEPLIVLATSISTLDKQAYSILYPNDIIYYDITGGDNRDIAFFDSNTAITGLKGVITYREDTIQNNKLHYDFRNVKFRRWMVDAIDWVANSYIKGDVTKYSNILYMCKTTHIGIISPDLDTINWQKCLDQLYYYSWTSNKSNFNIGGISTTNLSMSGYTDLYTFGSYYNFVNNVEIDKIHLMVDNIINTRLNNIVFNTTNSFQTCYSNKIGYDSYANTIGPVYRYNKIGSYSQYNVIIDSKNNIVGNSTLYNIINEYNNNMIGNYYYFNLISDHYELNNIGNNYSNNIIGSNYTNNTISNDYQYNIIGSYYSNNIIGNNYQYYSIGTGFTKNNVENCTTKTSNYSKVIFGEDVTMNTFKDGCFGEIASDLILTGSTYLNQTYNKTIYMSSESATILKFDNNTGTTFVSITA